MKLSKQSGYAIRIILFLLKNPKRKYLGEEITESCLIPKRVGLKIISDLAKRSFILSEKGKQGGIICNKKAKDINVYDVIKIYDSIQIKDCVEDSYICEFGKMECKFCFEMKRLQIEIKEKFKNITFDKLL